MKTILVILLVFAACETKAQMFGAIASQAATSVNLITNGDFATNLDGWTTSNPDWVWNSGKLEKDASTSGNGIFNYSGSTMVVGNTYRFTYTLSGTNGKAVTIWTGTTTGTSRTVDGTYTEDLQCVGSTDVKFFPAWNFEGFIDDVIVTIIP